MQGSQGKVHKLVANNHRITDHSKIEHKIFFYKSIFKNNIKKTLSEQTNFSVTLQIPKISDYEGLLCEGELTESDLYDALKNIPNTKFQGNDGMTK